MAVGCGSRQSVVPGACRERAAQASPSPLLSAPQDPGFASQALINKKLNDYRKVRYAPGAVGHEWGACPPRDVPLSGGTALPELFIHLSFQVMEQKQCVV